MGTRNLLPKDDDLTDARMDYVGLDLPAISACLAILAGTLSEPEDQELTRLLSLDDIQAPERSLADAPEESPADSPTYWWVGMYGQVEHEVAACTVCNRFKATFDVKDPEPKPLPIMGMFYRWGVDLCKLPQKSDDGNWYVVVMVEHFTKWMELRAIPAKEAKDVAAAFWSAR
ncbi:hypothetical protein KFL_012970015 [Klebsormidium nitens]|uniref:Integrase catalytic domain-containing protein n=1 Tax=Klebsormidium nitens TaxID=105231 RepID=A0A1Y1IXS6_KLENI|nr:hypothetical protein KFL_012970015 [Klebsormidium nitens]|eukprot:GAQ93098.1 hypothetical protein KFL_012970015 [Klebsormidium nitens]